MAPQVNRPLDSADVRGRGVWLHVLFGEEGLGGERRRQTAKPSSAVESNPCGAFLEFLRVPDDLRHAH